LVNNCQALFEVQRVTMDITELITRLHDLGVDIPTYTIKRWAFTENVIPQPKQPKLQGRGYASNWSEEALEEAAAVWAMRYCNCKILSPNAVTPKIIGNVKLIAQAVFIHPHPFYRIIERMIDGLWPDEPFTYKDVEMKLVKDNKFNRLTITYIAALEKARRGISVREPRRMILKQDILERRPVCQVILDRMLAEEAEKRDRKLTRGEVRLVERRYEKAIVPPGVNFDMDVDLKPTKAECDEIELRVRQLGMKKFVDSRKFAMRRARIAVR